MMSVLTGCAVREDRDGLHGDNQHRDKLQCEKERRDRLHCHKEHHDRLHCGISYTVMSCTVVRDMVIGFVVARAPG